MSVKTQVDTYDAAHKDPLTVATRVYLHDKAHCSTINDEVLFRLRDTLSRTLSVPLNSIALTGSGQIGWSVKRQRPFDKTVSDLDFAIIDSRCFQLALEDAVATTRGFTDQTLFKDEEQRISFRDYATRGIIRPDLMPKCATTKAWNALTNTISRDAQPIASRASFVIYLSELLFVGKQKSALNVVRRHHP